MSIANRMSMEEYRKAVHEAEATAKPKGRHKYGAVKTMENNITFDSKAEARRYKQLQVLYQGGVIADLELQPRFPLVVNNHKVATYVADFRYLEVATGKRIVEDVKGMKTPVYNLKKKLLKALYDIDISEVRE